MSCWGQLLLRNEGHENFTGLLRLSRTPCLAAPFKCKFSYIDALGQIVCVKLQLVDKEVFAKPCQAFASSIRQLASRLRIAFHGALGSACSRVMIPGPSQQRPVAI